MDYKISVNNLKTGWQHFMYVEFFSTRRLIPSSYISKIKFLRKSIFFSFKINIGKKKQFIHTTNTNTNAYGNFNIIRQNKNITSNYAILVSFENDFYLFYSIPV